MLKINADFTPVSKPPFSLSKIASLTLDTVRESTPARVAYIENNMEGVVSADDLKTVPKGATLSSLAPKWDGAFVAMINGEYISRADWDKPVQPGEVVVFMSVTQGPGGKGGSNPLRIVAMIAVVALSFYIPTVALSMTGWAASAMGAAINFFGMMLINALIPPPSLNSNQNQPSPTYSTQFAGNSARIDQPIPVGYGQQFQYPDFATSPYARFENNEQIYSTCLAIGKGKYEILRTQIDDTDIRNFQDVSVAYVGPGQQYTSLSQQNLVDLSVINVAEVAGQDLRDYNFTGPFSICQPGKRTRTVEIDVSFSAGIGHMNDEGDIDGVTIGYELQARKVDDFDVAISEWATVLDTAFRGATIQPQQLTHVVDLVDPSRYQIRFRRTTPFVDSMKDMNTMIWAGARCRVTDTIVQDMNMTYVCVKVRASKQLSGMSQKRIGVVWRRHIPVWDAATGTFVTQFTRNPAWAILDMWRNSDYGKGLPLSRIDFASIKALAKVWEARNDHFDFIFDSKTTLMEAVDLAARAGRAVTLMRRGVFTVVRDSQQTIPVAIFSPKNILKNSFSMDFAMPSEDTPDAIELTYRDMIALDDRVIVAQLYQDQLYIYAHGAKPSNIEAPLKTVSFKIPGVTGQRHAMREAAYLAASSYWRRTSVTFSTELDGLLPAYGSLIAVSHDLPGWGQSAEVIGLNTTPFEITTSKKMDWEDGKQHYVRLMSPLGDASKAIEVFRGAADNKLVLAETPNFEIITGDADKERTKLIFGPVDNICEMVRVKSIKPSSDGTIQISGVVEDDRVHEADTAIGFTADPILGATDVDPYQPVPVYNPHVVDKVIALSLTLQEGQTGFGNVSVAFKGDGTAHITRTLQINGDLITVAPLPDFGVFTEFPVPSARAALFDIQITPVTTALGGFMNLPAAERKQFVPTLNLPCGFSGISSQYEPYGFLPGDWYQKFKVEIFRRSTGLVESSAIFTLQVSLYPPA